MLQVVWWEMQLCLHRGRCVNFREAEKVEVGSGECDFARAW